MMQSLAGLMKQITEISSYSMVPYPNLLNKSARLNFKKICIGLLITKHSITKKKHLRTITLLLSGKDVMVVIFSQYSIKTAEKANTVVLTL